MPDSSRPSMMGTTPIDPLVAAEALVRSYCGWDIAPERTETIKVDGNGTQHLFLPSIKVLDILEVSVNGSSLDINTLEWTETGIIKYQNGRWPDKYRAVTVTYTHGFHPSDVAWIVQQIADRVADTPKGIERVTVGQRSVTYRETAGSVALLDAEKQALEPYRLPGRSNR